MTTQPSSSATPADLTCRDVIDFLLHYVEDELPSQQRKAFDDHLALCAGCVRYLETYKQSIVLAKSAMSPSLHPPNPCPEHLKAAVLAAITAPTPRPPTPRPPTP